MVNKISSIEESILYPPLIRFLSEKGYQAIQNLPHGKFSPFEVDILGLKEKPIELFMVEAKLCHLNKALRQGIARLPYADYVSLAFPQPYAENVYGRMRYVLEDKGIGLIGVGGSAKEMIAPRRSIKQISTLKISILKELYEGQLNSHQTIGHSNMRTYMSAI